MFAKGEEITRRITSPEGNFSCTLAECYSAQAEYAKAGTM